MAHAMPDHTADCVHPHQGCHKPAHLGVLLCVITSQGWKIPHAVVVALLLVSFREGLAGCEPPRR